MRKIELIVIHCADTYSRMDIGVREIDEWHKQRGWDGIGYHYVIRRNGIIEKGRPETVIGAHAYGHNDTSIGICYAGGKGDNNTPEDNRTIEQKAAIISLVAELRERYPSAAVVGHNQLNKQKACPCFNVQNELS
jgi:N-acetyl-anhydromuramyl-L-alanine amidase AmpD